MGRPEARETAKFCLMMDKFFDCCNVRNDKDAKHAIKPFLKPYTKEDLNEDPLEEGGERFDFLKGMLVDLYKWRLSIALRGKPEEFSDDARQKMFISHQTYEGIVITVKSLMECVKYLLTEGGLDYVLSNKFCQDDLENYFGKQRAIGGYKDNLRVAEVSKNDDLIKSQFSNSSIVGSNVETKIDKYNDISEIPLKKRKRSKPDEE